MRRLFLWIAGALPAPVVIRRIAPMATPIAALITAGWAVFTYAQHLHVDRVRAGLELQRQYREIFGPDGAAGQLPDLFNPTDMETRVSRVMCDFLVTAQQMAPPPGGCERSSPDLLVAMQTRIEALPDTARADLRRALQADQSARKWPSQWHSRFEALLSFYHGMGVCIAQDTCDAQVTMAVFQREVVPFLNATCAAFEQDAVALADAQALARLIRQINGAQGVYWDNEGRRDDPFLCPVLRADQRGTRP